MTRSLRFTLIAVSFALVGLVSAARLHAQQPSSPAPPRVAPLHTEPVRIDSLRIDPVRSRFGFELRTRWGQRVSGAFPRYDGEVVRLPDGRQQVRIRLATADVVVAGSERYTALARGENFFDAQRYPMIEFVSEPHPRRLARDGGRLRGVLTLHGVRRHETFVLQPAGCADPGVGCDVVASGVVSRDDYGLDGWRFALANPVRFDLRLRLQDASR